MFKKNILGAMIVGICGQSIAAQQASNVQDINLHPFAVITAGVDFIHTNHSQNVSLIPPFTNHYASNSSYPTSAGLGLGGGLEGHPSDRFFWQLGFSGFFNTSVTSTGEVWQFGLPGYHNFNYVYHIQSSRVVATGKVLSTFKQVIHPYVSGELGAAFNAASSYQEIPLSEDSVAMSPFAGHTRNSFSWGIGTGVDVDINAHLRIGIGYQFVDLGKTTLGLSPAQATFEQLGISNLYTHQARFQLTALA